MMVQKLALSCISFIEESVRRIIINEIERLDINFLTNFLETKKTSLIDIILL